MGSVDVVPIVDEGLGNTAYLVALGDGRALAVDASRDLRALRAAAAHRGLRVAYAADTHLHADFLTGAVQLAAGSGHVPGAAHVELGELTGRVPDLPPGRTVVMCGHGERAMGAASLLQRAGRHDIAVLEGGPRDWERATGQMLETGR
ncbi:MAG TPA: rhodanese-like domain-containing protein [Pedococcus sp.]|uniref:rhodanese-like domain-containing protein n=1 Tax=Pedococcus sp. TaxID=2860345 RepID=UPI002F949F85